MTSKQWTPNTDGVKVPQPAGHQCADWYQRCQPEPVDLLYALVHVKGERDRLVEALRTLCNAEHDYGEIDNVAVNQAWGPAMQLLRDLGELE